MSQQAFFDGFDAPAAPTDRVFFALTPDSAAAERAEAMAHAVGVEYGAKPRHEAREKFHITLFHVGDFVGLPGQTVSLACRVAAELRAQPLPVSLDMLLSFWGSPKRQPYVLLFKDPPQALMAFQADMQTRMLKAGLTQGHNHRHYTPHLTLLYGHQKLQERAVEPPVSWTAQEFVLIRSFIGQGRYETLGRWPMSSAQGG